jgi:hypothetical protein
VILLLLLANGISIKLIKLMLPALVCNNKAHLSSFFTACYITLF